MARKRIGGEGREGNAFMTEERIIVDSFKSVPKTSSKLFGDTLIDTPASKLSPTERDYYIIANALKDKYKGSPIKSQDSIKLVAHFFQVHYKQTFGIECIDYNWHYFLRAMEGVMTYFQFTDFIQLADFISRSFIRFPGVKKRLNLTDKYITLSTYRQAWILAELNEENGKKFDGFY